MNSGISLKDVAEKTKIRLTYLQALEEDRLDGLPEGAYRSGFMRIYAEFLGLSPQMVLERYRQQGIGDDPEPPEPVEPEPTISRKKKNSLALLLIPVLVLVGAGIAFFYRPLASEPPQTLAEKPKAFPTSKPPTAWSPPAEMNESSALPASQNPAPRPVQDLPEPSALEPVPPGEPGGIREPTVALAFAAQPVSRPAVSEIRLETVAAVEFAIAVDGRPRREYNVPANVVLKWKARQGVRLETENPSAMRVWMDNRLIEAVQWPLVLPRPAASSAQ